MAQKLVAQAFALGCALYESCDVIKLDRRVNRLLGIVHFVEHLQTLIRNCYNTYIRFDRAKRIVCRFCPCFCDRIKQSTFANVRQSYDS